MNPIKNNFTISFNKFFFNNIKKNIKIRDICLSFININVLYNNTIENFYINHNNITFPYYDPNTNIINIPVEIPLKSDFSSEYKKIESFLKNKSFEYMLFHEIGHAVQHANCEERSYKTNPINLESPLSYLFNGSSRPML